MLLVIHHLAVDGVSWRILLEDVAAEGEYQFQRRKVGTSPSELRRLADWLVAEQVEQVVMESTAQYWRPVWATLEQIIEEVKKLPTEEKLRLRAALEQLTGNGDELSPYRTREDERAWLEAHGDEFLDQWVVLEADQLVAHGTDTLEEVALADGRRRQDEPAA